MADEREQLHLEISEAIVPGADLATYAKVCKIVDRLVAERDEARAERDRWVAQNVRLADERDEARRVVKQVNDNCADFAEAIGLSRDSYGDEIIATAQRLVAERDDYRANGKEAAKVAFGVSEKLATVEAELAETHAAHRAALLGVSRPGQPTYEALEEHVAGLVQENGVLRGELDEAQRSANFWQSQAESWEREHQNTVLPYTSQLEDERALLAWLHAEAVWQREQLRIEADHQWRVRRQAGHRLIDMDTELTEAVDLARWLIAEARWQQDQARVRELRVLADRDGLSTHDVHTLADHIEAGDWMEGDPGPRAAPVDRESLGRLVRKVWIGWAREQPDPKPSWLIPWEELAEPDREVDRRIGETLARAGISAGLVARTPSDLQVPPSLGATELFESDEEWQRFHDAVMSARVVDETSDEQHSIDDRVDELEMALDDAPVLPGVDRYSVERLRALRHMVKNRLRFGDQPMAAATGTEVSDVQ